MRSLKLIVLVLVTLTVAAKFDCGIIAVAEAKSGKHRANAHGLGKKAGFDNVWDRLTYGLRIPIPGPSPYGDQVLAVLPDSAAVPANITTAKAGTSAANDNGKRLSSVIIPKKSGGQPTNDSSRVRHKLMPTKNGDETLATDAVKDHYTALGRLKLGPKELKNPKLKKLYKNGDVVGGFPNEAETVKGGGLFKSPMLQRMRTRLGLQPELSNNPENNTGQVSGSTTKASDKSAEMQLVIKGCADFNKSSVMPLVKKGLLSERYMQLAERCRSQQNAAYARINRHVGGYGREYLQSVGERARPFLYHIVDSLSKHGLPLDLALLPIVESAYQPTALSSASAAGIWQFIPSTGQTYGLQQTAYHDERLDVTAETLAAVRFLSYLRDHYRGDWQLALAAYNAGPGTVDAAISRNLEAGLGADFWSLSLPAETQDYVPRLLALSSIFRTAGSKGLKLRPLKNEAYFIKVDIEHDADIGVLAAKDLASVAKMASLDAQEFTFLNAAYIKSTVPIGKPVSFLLPIRNANLLHQSLAFMAQSEKNLTSAPLPELDLLVGSAPAKTETPWVSFHFDQELQPPSFQTHVRMFAGIKPALSSDDKKEIAASEPQHEDWVVHYLDKGESLQTVAEFHGIDEADLREANKIKRKQVVSLGQRLLVPLKFPSLEPVRKKHPSILYGGMSG